MKSKLIVIVGQTSTGKSDYAVKLAKKINGEVVSADSRQVYKGLNIGSGKITKKEMCEIPHHMLDVANPKNIFSVADFKKMAEEKIDEIIAKGKAPILVGGTGFYIDAVVNGNVLPEVPPNKKLRLELSNKTLPELLKILEKLDKARFKTIDRDNPVRLIRAIEIAKALGKVPKIKSKPKYDVEIIGLTMNDEKLKMRIHDRLLARIKSGMIKEVKDLHEKNKVSWKRLYELGLEYRFVSLFLQNKLSKSEMLIELENQIWKYAKRQKTWFKRDERIKWMEVK